MSRILRNTAADIEVTVTDSAGDEVTFSGTPTVSVVHGETGAAVASDDATVDGGKLRFTLTPAMTAAVKPLVATWLGTVSGQAMQWTTYHEVVGDLLFTIPQMRAFDNGALSSEDRYTDAAIAAFRDVVAESFEDVAGIAPGARYRREVLDGGGHSDAWLSKVTCIRVLGIETREHGSRSWTAFTSDELDDVTLKENGWLVRELLGPWPLGYQNVRVEYEYGWQPIPEEIRQAAMWLTRDRLAGTDIPRNAIGQTSELGTFTLATPGMRGSWYGLPQVDEPLHRLGRRMRGVA